MNRPDPQYVVPDKEGRQRTVNDLEDPIAPPEVEAEGPVQSSSDVDMLRRVLGLLTEGP